jgi:glycosyltransferase involved in cell wall biosynthesis
VKLLEQRGLTWSGLVKLFINNFRESGVRVTVRKALGQLSRTDVSFDIDRYRKWFWRYNTENGARAAELFSSPAVIIIGSLDIPQCKKYRVMQKVEYFTSREISCEYAEYRDLTRAFSGMQLATVLILYRVPSGPEFEALQEEAERLGLTVFYDIDDPIFDEVAYGDNRNLDALSVREREALLAQIPGYKRVMEAVGRVIVSTNGMRERVKSATSVDTVLVWPNLIDSATENIFEQLPARQVADGDTIALGYFSGSRAHDSDLDLIADVLAELLRSDSRLQLYLGGYTRLPAALNELSERVTFLGFMSYHAYLENMAAMDIHLVPLLIDRFNACKSGIRYLEASMCRVPTVASRVGQFTEMIEDGTTGFLCNSTDDWRHAIDLLINDPGRRMQMARAAREEVRATHSLASECFNTLGEVITDVA